jgi:hypothetical protein
MKIKPIFEALVNKFQTIYIPEEKIAIDESLLLYKGKLGMKQYIPMKRSRFGIKLYQLCESGTGYIWNSMVHTGPDMILENSLDNLTSSRIVLTLAKKLLEKGYTIYMDNWYTSPALFRELVSKKTNAVGTVRTGRKNMPAELKNKIKKGETVYFETDDIIAMKWHDKREVTMLSTFHKKKNQ